jgi:hypothetical protein
MQRLLAQQEQPAQLVQQEQLVTQVLQALQVHLVQQDMAAMVAVVLMLLVPRHLVQVMEAVVALAKQAELVVLEEQAAQADLVVLEELVVQAAYHFKPMLRLEQHSF